MTREITILPVLNGFVCRVGCQMVVFEDRTKMLTELERYYADPDKSEKRYLETAVNKTVVDTPATCQEPATNIARSLGESLRGR